ncbi:MAG TPA: transporter [Desulfonatronum sp.]|mgnify:CR=1 FL=1|nr:transporter [Desulfonatronum sp.]
MARIVVLTFLLVFSSFGSAFGAGFALYEFSARGNALGGTLVGRADDPSALAYNPAGITQLPGKQVQGGLSVITPMVDVTTTNPYTREKMTTRSDRNYWIPPHLYYTHQLTDRLWLGLGVLSRFGLGTEFKDDWPGRYNSRFAGVQTASINPNLAYKLTDNLTVAVGAEAMWMDIELRRAIDGSPFLGLPITNNPATSAADIGLKLKGDSWGYGFNVALHYVPSDMLKFGLSYRGPVKQKVKGDAKFDSPVAHPIFFRDTDASGNITLPDMIFAGVAVYPTENLSLEFSTIYTFWSKYDKLTFKFDDPVLFGQNSSTSVKDWKDVWRFQFGVEYSLNPNVDLRASYIYDQSPVPDKHADYLIPANNRHLFSFGPGFHWGSWTLDLSYTYLHILDRDIQARVAEGVYDSEFTKGHAHIMGLSLGYKF